MKFHRSREYNELLLILQFTVLSLGSHDLTMFDLVFPIKTPNFWKPSGFFAIIIRALALFYGYFSADNPP